MAADRPEQTQEPETSRPRRGGIWHYIISLILLAAGLIGLGMSLCGGVYVAGALLGDSSEWMGAILIISVPSLLIGVAIMWFGFRALGRRWS